MNRWTNRISHLVGQTKPPPIPLHPLMPATVGTVVFHTDMPLITFYWEDEEEIHYITYSIELGIVIIWNSTPIRR